MKKRSPKFAAGIFVVGTVIAPTMASAETNELTDAAKLESLTEKPAEELVIPLLKDKVEESVESNLQTSEVVPTEQTAADDGVEQYDGSIIPPPPEEPDPEEPDPENPDPENPDPENPDPENPDPENPDPENPDPENPDPENPDPENPDPENPDPEKPGPGTGPTDPKPVPNPDPDPIDPGEGEEGGNLSGNEDDDELKPEIPQNNGSSNGGGSQGSGSSQGSNTPQNVTTNEVASSGDGGMQQLPQTGEGTGATTLFGGLLALMGSLFFLRKKG